MMEEEACFRTLMIGNQSMHTHGLYITTNVEKPAALKIANFNQTKQTLVNKPIARMDYQCNPLSEY